jgi:uncharacterized protein YukE
VTQPEDHANYDFTAAQELSALLAEAARRVDEFADNRARWRADQLDRPDEKWQGGRRRSFDQAVAPQQRTLHDLATRVRQLRSAVEAATEQARAIRPRPR